MIGTARRNDYLLRGGTLVSAAVERQILVGRTGWDGIRALDTGESATSIRQHLIGGASRGDRRLADIRAPFVAEVLLRRACWNSDRGLADELATIVNDLLIRRARRNS